MKIADLKLADGNHFVALEYYGLILNRTLLVLVTDECLIGVVANGLISASAPGSAPLSTLITNRMSVRGDLNDPLSYLSQKYLDKIAELDLLGPEVLRANRANFQLRFDEISAVTHDPTKKWGMGHYPHDGKVYVTANGKTREFVMLGKQSGSAVATSIMNKAGLGGNAQQAMHTT